MTPSAIALPRPASIGRTAVICILLKPAFVTTALACADEPLDLAESRSESALDYKTDLDWEWHQRLEGVQIWYDEDNERLTFRMVNQRDEWSVYAYLDPGYELTAAIIFHTPCKPEQYIEVPADDSHKFTREISCLQDGSGYLHTGQWQSKTTRGEFNFVWEDNLDGHAFQINFANWDFSPLVAEKDKARERPPLDTSY